MNFVTGLLVFSDKKGETYNSILVIIDWLIKMIYYEPVKVIINASGLVKVIFDMIVRHHGFPDFIFSYRGSVFTLKFSSSLCYFLVIKMSFLITFYAQTNDKTEKQNSNIEAYLWAFLN